MRTYPPLANVLELVIDVGVAKPGEVQAQTKLDGATRANKGHAHSSINNDIKRLESGRYGKVSGGSSGKDLPIDLGTALAYSYASRLSQPRLHNNV